MRIRELKLIRFGKFTDRTLHLPQQEMDIHLIVGPNEAGKSTVRTAISDWLFGIPMRTPLAFLHPMPDLRIGGVLERASVPEETLQSFAFDRTKGNKNTLRTPEDANLPEAMLIPWLAGLQAPAFNRMYALDHTTLVEGGAGILSASDDVGRLLFQSAAGVEHLGDVLQKLQDEADALWGPRKASSRLYYQAQERYDAAHAQFKQATLRTKDWTQRHEALTDIEKALAGARAGEVEIRQQLSRLERIRRVRPMLLALDVARCRRDELMSVEAVPLLSENASQVLKSALQDMALIRADLSRLQQEMMGTQDELDNTLVYPSVLELGAEITELSERRLQYRAHASDLLKRAEEVSVEWLRIQELASDLGWDPQEEGAVRQRLPAAPVRARLLRMLKGRSDIAQELRMAQGNFTERQQQVQQAQQALDSLSVGRVPAGLSAALEQALKLGDHDSTMSDLQRRVAALSQDLASTMEALGTWRLAPDALNAMVVPQAALVQGLLDQHRSDASQLQSLQDAVATKAQDISRMELELQQFEREFQPVSLEQVQAARQARNEVWHSIKAAPDALPQQAETFEGYMVEADGLADARLDRAQHQADRQAKLARLEHQRLEHQGVEAHSQALQTRMALRLAEWNALTRSCGVPELPLDVAQVWFHQRQLVLDLKNEQAQAHRQLSEGLETAAHLQQTVWKLLAGDDSEQPPPALAECVRQARAVITLADQAQGQRKTLEQQLRDGQSSLVGAQASVQIAQSAWEAWLQAWQAAAQAAGYDASASADQVEAEIAVMQDVERRLERIRSIRSERINPMQADLDSLSETAKGLAERLAPELAAHLAQDIAFELAQRLDRAKQAQTTYSGLQQRLARAQAEHTAAQQRQLAVQASLAPLMAAANVQEIDALASVVERSDLRREIEQTIESAQSDLAKAADGLPEEALRLEAADIDPDALKAQLEGLTERSSKAVEEIASLSNNYGTQKSAFDALVGKDDAAQAEAMRQEAIAMMGDAAQRYLRLQTAVRLLKWSMEKFRETKQGPMLAKASVIFSGLTRGSFNRLLVDTEESTPRLFGIRPDGEQVDVTGMSEGSRDQLYLALRLAALELQIDQGLSMPLIADDLFINFDDSRTAAGLRVLGDLSTRMQVIFLTHHDHLVPLARDVLGPDLNVVQL